MPDMNRIPRARLPVLVGLGAARESAPVTELMCQAAVAAAHDAGAPSLLASVDRIAVPQGSWSLTDPGRTVAHRIGAGAARTTRYELGVSQQEMVNHALRDVASGTCDAVLVVGGEARGWARAGGAEEDPEKRPPDEVVRRPADFVAAVELAAGIVWPPVQQYAMIENALAADEGLDAERQRREIAELWARFNAVATHNPDAAFAAPRDAAALATAGPANRPLAHPYNHWHASQWTVDQASALLVCSTEHALSAGVPADRWLFPRVALHSSGAITLTARRHLAAWPAMGVLGRAAEAHVGRPLRELRLVEVYSCFPSAVRVQVRELGLHPDGTPTLTGGMTFAGGPFNHAALQSTVALGSRLREEPGELGLVTTVSGMLSKPGLALWSATPPPEGRPPLVADMAAQAASATATLPVVDEPPKEAVATVASFTVTYDQLEPHRTAVVADLADGVRTAAACENASTARLALSEGLIGRPIFVKGATFSL